MASNPAKFLQDPPQLGNQYLEDTTLLDILKRRCPPNILSEIEPDLIKWGDRVLGDVLVYGRESENNPPKLTQIDAYGRRIDNVSVAPGWDRLKDISAEEGLVAIGYERKYAEFSRLYQYVKLYLFTASSAVFICPLGMTDGAARVLELQGDEYLKKDFLPHFVTRDPKQFWTSGQWMTERPGGSDVGNSETIAVKNKDGTYSISGYKFFTSASTSEATFMLARVVDEKGNSIKGSRGLSTFAVKMRNEDGSLNGLKVHKLKNKLGTKAVPTAEMELNQTQGRLVGPINRGIPVISSILNITRIHNAIMALSWMRRAIAVARDYAHRRSATGRKLIDLPLHLSVLADMEVEFRGALQLLFDVILVMGLQETGKATPFHDFLFRILTPLLKLYTAKQAIAVISEGLECLGGPGYMEDSDMPRLLRDAQVLSIWEGTTNVLSMDVWRPLGSNSFVQLADYMTAKLENAPASLLDAVTRIYFVVVCNRVFDEGDIKNTVSGLNRLVEKVAGDKDTLEASARRFAYSLSRAYIATLLVEQAKWSRADKDVHVVNRWLSASSGVGLGGGAVKVPEAGDAEWRKIDRILALNLNADGTAAQSKIRARY